jgi:hypothetical protein
MWRMAKGPDLRSIQGGDGGKVISLNTGRDFPQEVAEAFQELAERVLDVFDQAASQIDPKTGDSYLSKALAVHINQVIKDGYTALINTLEEETNEYGV